MGLFDKIKGQLRKTDKTPAWMNVFNDQWEQLDRTTAGRTGSDAEHVHATIVPMLVDEIEVLKKNFVAYASGFVSMGLMPVIGGKRNALGMTWCQPCQHPTMIVAEPSAIQKQTCSVCGRESDIQFLHYSPAVGKQVRELFAKHVAYIDLIEGGKELALKGKSDLAMGLYSEARAAAQSVQNMRAEAGALNAIADVKFKLKDFDAALTLDTESQRLYRQAGDRIGVMHTMQKRGFSFLARAEAGHARVLFERVEDLCHTRPDDPNHMLRLATALGTKSRMFLMRMSTIDQARGTADKGRDVARKLNRLMVAKGLQPVLAENDHVQAVDQFLQGLGVDVRKIVQQSREMVYEKRGVTMEGLRTIEAVARSIGDTLLLNLCLNVQLEHCWTSKNDRDQAAAVARVMELPRISEALEDVTRKRSDDKALAAALQVRVQILTAIQDDGARAKAKEAEAAVHGVEAADREIATLEGQESSAHQAKDWPRLRELALRHIAFLRSRGRHGETVPVLNRLAAAERGLGNPDAVCDAFEQIETVGHEWGDRQLVADAQNAEGEVLQEMDDWDGALGRYHRAALAHNNVVKAGHSSPEVLLQRRNDLLRVRHIGDLHMRGGDLPAAILAFRTAVGLGESMLEHTPDDHELRLHHIAVFDELAVTLLRGDKKQRDEGMTLVRKALSDLDQLDRKDPDHRADRDAIRTEIRSHLQI